MTMVDCAGTRQHNCRDVVWY